ncbi:hypothetical protein DTL42_07780 [Bremerella cremea]|uniref:Uncharacterized protein n=1 Tax=Bremerella cremea TaxID=1031537 RepID=A0A368KST6_9BACT|nr:hypothetical protein [Bremerella cremea]RCS52727.1 hypothetical protein DTL42_07780 [Bremerella cremea]
MASESEPENPFESPRFVDDEPLPAQLVPEPPFKKKKELAPTSVVMLMLLAMALTPGVPLGFYYLGAAGVLVAGFNFVFSMLLLMKMPSTWWMGNLFYGALFASFFTGNILCSGCIPAKYMHWSYLGMLASGVVLVLLSVPASRKYYFGVAS